MEKLKIAVDIDNVIRGFTESVVKVYQKEYPNHKIKFPINDWKLEKFFPIGKDIYQFMFHDFVDEIYNYNAPLLDTANVYLDLITERGHKVTLLTCQNEKSEKATNRWLDKNHIFYHNMIVVRDSSDKLMYDWFDLYIDDKTETINEFHLLGKNIICRNQLWNKGKVYEQVPKVNSFREFYEIVLKMEQNKCGILTEKK